MSEVLGSDWQPSQIPPDSSRGRVDSERVTITYTCCEGEPGRVLDLSVRPLACTGSGDGTLSFGPLSPMVPMVVRMDSFSMELRRRFWRLVSPRVFLRRHPLRDRGDVA